MSEANLPADAPKSTKGVGTRLGISNYLGLAGALAHDAIAHVLLVQVIGRGIGNEQDPRAASGDRYVARSYRKTWKSSASAFATGIQPSLFDAPA